MVIFEGGLSYTDARDMPLPELAQLHKEAERLARRHGTPSPSGRR